LFSSALPARRAAEACVAPLRAPITRSKSPRRAAMRRASSGGCWPSASTMRTNSPLARRMPVFTAAPFPLLYGCRTTHAPASRALAPVSSADPSSTTMISRHRAAPRSCETTPPMASASFIAGMTMETSEQSAKELLDDAVPGNRARGRLSGAAETLGERPVAGEPVDGGCQRGRLGCADESVDAVAHELERAAGIGGRDDGPCREKRLERHVSVVLVEGRVKDAPGAGIEVRDGVAPQRTGECNPVRDAALRGFAFERRALGAVADDDEADRRGHVGHRANREVHALERLQTRHEQDVIAVGAVVQAIGDRRRMVQRAGGK